MNSGNIDLIADKALLDRLEIYYRIFCEGYNNSSEYHKMFNIHNTEGPLLQRLIMNKDGTWSLESLKKKCLLAI